MTNKEIKMTVSEIFTLMRKGQKSEGVTLLYNNHYNRMFGVAFSMVKNEDISNDIIHNVVYKLLKIEESKLPTSNEFAWLYTVVKNEALMFLRNERPVLSLDDVAAPLTDDISIREFVDMDEFYSMIKREHRKLLLKCTLGRAQTLIQQKEQE